MRLLVLIVLFILSPISFGAIQVEQIEAWAKSNPQAKVEDFLTWVKKTDPEQMSWFTLMKQSQSAQGGSPLNPRAIVFGPTSKFIFTFNGEEKQDGYQDVEMLFFREGTEHQKTEAKWELRKLSFNSQAGTLSFSGPNPNSCLACHQNPVRPIWSEYEVWKGAYGENDDTLLSTETRKKETTAFKKFLKHKETHSRYSKLQFPEGSPVSPYSIESKSRNYRLRPNLKLTESLLGLHSKVLLSQIKNHSQFEKEKKLLAATLLDCDSFRDSYSNSIQSLLSQLDEQFKNHSKGTVPWNKPGYEGANSRRHYVLYLLGIEHTDFSLEKEATKWSFYDGHFYSQQTLALEVYNNLIKSEPGLPALKDNEIESREEACRQLLDSRLSAGKIEAVGPEALTNPVIICMGCHLQGGVGPYLPFDDKDKLMQDKVLKELIISKITSANKDFRMPPTRPLSEKEIQGIQDWLSKE